MLTVGNDFGPPQLHFRSAGLWVDKMDDDKRVGKGADVHVLLKTRQKQNAS
jgi:hypothetical protein